MCDTGLTDSATILAGTFALTSLCHHLVENGALTAEQFELIRHDHLHQFDALLGRIQLSPAAARHLDQRRADIARMWDQAGL